MVLTIENIEVQSRENNLQTFGLRWGKYYTSNLFTVTPALPLMIHLQVILGKIHVKICQPTDFILTYLYESKFG